MGFDDAGGGEEALDVSVCSTSAREAEVEVKERTGRMVDDILSLRAHLRPFASGRALRSIAMFNVVMSRWNLETEEVQASRHTCPNLEGEGAALG